MLTRLRAARSGEDGMTLMEIMVAMAVSAVLAVMAGYFFIGTSSSSTAATEQSLQNSQAREVLQQWTQLLRVADSPSQAGTVYGRIVRPSPPAPSPTLSFWAAMGNRTDTTAASGLSLVSLSIANGTLSQTVTDPAGNTSTRTLLGCTVSDATGGVKKCASYATVVSGQFTPYYTATGCQTASLTSAGLCAIDPASPPSTNDIVAVGISFTVDGADGRSHANAQTYSTLVALGSTT